MVIETPVDYSVRGKLSHLHDRSWSLRVTLNQARQCMVIETPVDYSIRGKLSHLHDRSWSLRVTLNQARQNEIVGVYIMVRFMLLSYYLLVGV